MIKTAREIGRFFVMTMSCVIKMLEAINIGSNS